MDGRQLIRTAIDNLPSSYAPYSRFHVSATLLCKGGTVYTWNNIENAAYNATVCAKRSAFFRTLNEGKRELEIIVICSGMNGEIADYCAPCDVCWQMMRELCSPETFRIILAKTEDDYRVSTLGELLPLRFGPENLRQ